MFEYIISKISFVIVDDDTSGNKITPLEKSFLFETRFSSKESKSFYGVQTRLYAKQQPKTFKFFRKLFI